MSLRVSCPTCGHQLGIPDNFAGEQFRCKNCLNAFQVPRRSGQLQPAARPDSNPPSPAVHFSCPNCKAQFDSPASQAGTKFHCSSCGQKIQVPHAAPSKTVLGEVTPRGKDATVRAGEGDDGRGGINITVNATSTAPKDEPPRRRRQAVGQEPKSGNGWGVASVVCGSIGFVLGVIPCVGLFTSPLCVLGIIFGVVGWVAASKDEKKPKWLPATGAILGLCGLLATASWFVLGAIVSKNPAEQVHFNAPQDKVVNVSARELLQAYADNQFRADQEFKGGRVRVTGTVTGFLGTSVHLENFPAVSCFGLRDDEVARLNRGQEATVEGSVSIGNAGGVHLLNCRLVR